MSRLVLLARGREVNVGGGGAGTGSHVARLGDHAVGIVNAGFGFAGPRFGPAAQPLHFPTHPGFPAMLLLAGLGVQKLIFSFQERTLISLERAEGLQDKRGSAPPSGWPRSPESNHHCAYHNAGKIRALQQLFQPLNAFKIKMVGGLIPRGRSTCGSCTSASMMARRLRHPPEREEVFSSKLAGENASLLVGLPLEGREIGISGNLLAVPRIQRDPAIPPDVSRAHREQPWRAPAIA